MNASKLVLAAAAVAALSACIDVSGSGGFECQTEAPVISGRAGDTILTAIGLRYLDTKVGTGTTVEACDRVGVQYRAFVAGEATPFDSTGSAVAPYVAGGGQLVIAGLDVGVIGMKQGGTRRLFIPSELGFGSQAVTFRGRTIPAGSPLIFDVQMVEVTPRPND